MSTTNELASMESSKENPYTYELIDEIAQYLLNRTKYRPLLGIICGTGLGSLADKLDEPVAFKYEDIPHFPVSTVKGHAGRLVFGLLSGVPVMCMQGRFHGFEGYPLWKCAMPVRLMKLIGVSHLIITNAAGGLNPNLQVGDIMVLKDHIFFMGLAGNCPLNGPNDARFGTRFPAMNKAYELDLRKQAVQVAKDLGISDLVKEGVYACVGGPFYETISELKMLQMFGADAVGMSTAPEVVTAKHCGLTVFGFSLITNMCIMDYQSLLEPNHEEVVYTGKIQEPVVEKFVTEMVKLIHDGIINK